MLWLAGVEKVKETFGSSNKEALPEGGRPCIIMAGFKRVSPRHSKDKGQGFPTRLRHQKPCRSQFGSGRVRSHPEPYKVVSHNGGGQGAGMWPGLSSQCSPKEDDIRIVSLEIPVRRIWQHVIKCDQDAISIGRL